MRRFPRGVKGIELVLGIAMTLLLAMIVIAPFTLPSGSVKDLSGTVGTIDNQQQLSGMNPFAQGIYLFGDVNCHQIAERSYYLNGNEMPICARDLGILIGLPMTLFIIAFSGFRPRLWMVILFAVPMAIDGGLQLVSDYTSTNELRLITGLCAGAATAMFLAILAQMSIAPDEAECKPADRAT